MKQDKTQFKIVSLKMKLMRIRREIDATIDYLNEVFEEDDRKRCEKCGWRNLSCRKNGTYFCKSCGFISKPKKK